MTMNSYAINSKRDNVWRKCQFCENLQFQHLNLFVKHLREVHCTKEGGSYVCHYGANAVCPTLPLDGVSDEDYQNHVKQCHTKRPSQTQNQGEWSLSLANQNLAAVLTNPKKGKQLNFFTRTWGEHFTEHAIVPKSVDIPFEVESKHFNSYRLIVSDRITKKSPNSIIETTPQITPNTNEIPEIFIKSKQFIQILKFLTPLNYNQNEKIHDLANYLDIVELEISHQIAEKSDRFFQAIKSSNNITDDIRQICSKIQQFRRKLQLLQHQTTKPILHLLHLKQKQTRLTAVLEKLDFVSTVLQAQPSLQVLLNNGDYVAALELISGTKSVLHSDLRHLHCLRYVTSQFDDTLQLVEKMLNSDLEKLLNTHFLLLLDNGSLIQDFDCDFLISLITAFVWKGDNSFFLKLKDETFLIIELLLQKLFVNYLRPVPIVNNIDVISNLKSVLNSNLESVQLIEFGDWFSIIQSILKSLSDLLGFIQLIARLIEQVLDSNLWEKSPIEVNNFRMQMENSLIEICNYGQDRVACLLKLQLGYRQQQTLCQTRGISEQILILNQFIDYCKSITNNNSSNVLKIAIKTQMEIHLQKFHSAKMTHLIMLLNNETWRPLSDVPDHFRRLVSQLILNECSKINFDDDYDGGDSNNDGSGSFMVVDGDKFVVSSCVLMFLKFVAEYCYRSDQLTILKSVINNHLMDLLRSFNTTTSRLILGAEAQKRAGLQRITIQNMSVALKSLELVEKVFQSLRNQKRFEKNISSQLDDILRAIHEHVNQLFAKIIATVTTAIDQSLVHWEGKPPMPSNSFKEIFFNYDKSKQAVCDILLKEQVSEIFNKIHLNFIQLLRDKLIEMNLIHESGPKKAQVKFEFSIYMEKLRCLDVMPMDNIANFNDLWN